MKYILKNTMIMLLAIAAFSCKKSFLNRPPEDQLTNANFYSTKAELLAGTAPLYNIVWFDYNDKAMLSFGDARGGNMISNDRDMFYRFAVPATDPWTLLPAYKSFYKIVAQANTTMQNIKKYAVAVADIDKQAAVAECRFMRAMGYYYLVTTWGAVPIIYDNVPQMSDQSVRRNTIESVWEMITRDLTYASKNLPATAPQVGRLTSWSAKGMLAKMYLFRSGVGSSGGNRNQSYLDSAKAYAKDVCNNGPYSLQPNYGDLFKSEFNNSSVNNNENIFSIQWMPIKEPWGINNSFQAYMARDGEITGSWDGWGAAHGASADLIKYYLANPADSFRRKATFMFDNDFYPEIRKDRNGYLFPSSWNGTAWVKQTASIANTKKYIIGSVQDNGGKGSEMCEYVNTYMLRLAELDLVYSEAIMGNNTSTSDAEALKFYNRVRTRAGLPAKALITWDDIFQEKRIETVFEGSYWYELLRLYYFNPTKAKSIIAAQDKGAYTLQYVAATSNPRQYTVVYNLQTYAATDATFYLPMPEAELVKAPNLANPPVAFDFSVIPD
jgi:starch-binding outer membrane protein, SusD/RagB family